MTIKAAAVAGLLSLLVASDSVASTPGGKPLSNVQIKALLDRYHDLNSGCRGGQGDLPATELKCKQRDAAADKLEAAGWCYGHEDAAQYQKYWAPCGTHPDPTGAADTDEEPAPPTKRKWYAADINFSTCVESSRSPADRIRSIQEYGKKPEVNDLPGGAVEVGEPIGSGKTAFTTFYLSEAACTASLPHSRPVDRKYE